MKVRLIKRKSIEDFLLGNARARSSFGIWLDILKYADWQTPADIISSFGAADLLGNGSNRVVFDIGGNNYRMICKYFFGSNVFPVTRIHLYVKWIGTHAAYTSLCKAGQQHTINNY